MKVRRVLVWALAALLPAAVSAGSKLRLRPPLQTDHDQSAISKPRERQVSEIHAILYNTWLRHLSPEYQASRAADPGALNVNAWDEVPGSSWFANRMGLRSLSFTEIEAGLEGETPKPGTWTVTKIGDEGYTPKIDVADGAGRTYVLKFDLPAALERNSAAERICTLIMHAAGYNVPHNSIVYFRREDLRLGEKAKYTDALGKKQPLTPQVFESLIQKLKPMPDGRYRGLASLYLSGPAVGRFVYTGRRKDDPNDLIPHELRRELRGLRVIASWINHVDVGDKNALDVFIAGQDGRGYVRHYLLDFGSTMGSGDFINGPYRVGHEYIFDGSAIGKSFVTLGTWRRPWDVRGEIPYPEVGYFQAELFDPAAWKPNYPNLSFERMDDSDAYWGAKIVTAFTDDTIRRLAEAGEYTRPEVTRYIADVLKKRRDAIGRYWFDRITPLEGFALAQDGSNYRLSFRDLAVERGYALLDNRIYRIRLENADGRRLAADLLNPQGQQYVDVPGVTLKDGGPGVKPDRYGRIPVARLVIQAGSSGNAQALPVEVVLGYADDRTHLAVLGWYHAPHQ
ncbi:MAG: hypothetical protein LAP85_20225 [Acidobacteriia bacterium]|nr:hypothetical protein [Terriglobia bacterium]